ncbi:hypothetical protein OK024_08550 [Acinetobacter sp. UGAL515B_02]|uniref:hypothetical protein n=1 Tax=Acinetobacter soli TaxID=487316 RepID=UPI001BA8CF22|nr:MULTISPECIES: hypothetical protein [Acinetobacter]MBV6549480.1 hypothetical protein [Acinetobacter soli]WON81603.1 hypothetical protein OK024_08550 [Acinetobacter sp. UGAL515B_02]
MKKFLLCCAVLFGTQHALAANTTWSAGSTYKGTVTVPIESGPNVVWKCNGKACSMSGPWGDELSLDSCQSLVMRVGKISYYKNSAGKVWNSQSPELAACNKAAR